MTSSRYAPYELGYTRATKATTMWSEVVIWSKSLYKSCLSTDCTLKLKYMKEESLVIVYHHDTVNFFRPLYTPPVTRRELMWIDISGVFLDIYLIC